MTDLEIYNLINATRTVDELKDAIIKAFGEYGEIMGLTEPFPVGLMNLMIDKFAEDYAKEKNVYRSLPTRRYGIRQQLCYILMNPHRE